MRVCVRLCPPDCLCASVCFGVRVRVMCRGSIKTKARVRQVSRAFEVDLPVLLRLHHKVTMLLLFTYVWTSKGPGSGVCVWLMMCFQR